MVKVKGLCFLVIGFALVVSYQSNPLGTILIGGITIAIYLFFKSRKNRVSGRGSGVIYRKGSTSVSPASDLMTLLMIQTILDRGTHRESSPSIEKTEKIVEKNDMEQIKREVLALFKEE